MGIFTLKTNNCSDNLSLVNKEDFQYPLLSKDTAMLERQSPRTPFSNGLLSLKLSQPQYFVARFN